MEEADLSDSNTDDLLTITHLNSSPKSFYHTSKSENKDYLYSSMPSFSSRLFQQYSNSPINSFHYATNTHSAFKDRSMSLPATPNQRLVLDSQKKVQPWLNRSDPFSKSTPHLDASLQDKSETLRRQLNTTRYSNSSYLSSESQARLNKISSMAESLENKVHSPNQEQNISTINNDDLSSNRYCEKSLNDTRNGEYSRNVANASHNTHFETDRITSNNYSDYSPASLTNNSFTLSFNSNSSQKTVIQKPVLESMDNSKTIKSKSGLKDYSKVTNEDIKQIEQVRRFLKSILTSPSKVAGDVSFGLEEVEYALESPRDLNTGDTYNSRLSKMEEMPNEISYLSKSSNIRMGNAGDSTLTTENKLLRSVLEKERYRRQHCEKEIQELHVKLLETQQQLAVSESTERKKDTMIEQLDQTLGNIIDNWKSHEVEKLENMEKVYLEKETLEKSNVKREQVVKSLEKELSEVVDQLAKEQSKSSIAEKEKQVQFEIHKKERNKLLSSLVKEREQIQILKKHIEDTVVDKDKLHKQVQTLQEILKKEQRCWKKKEDELMLKLENFSQIQEEKKELAEEHKANISKLKQYQQRLDKLQLELELVKEEKVRLQTEFKQVEERFDASRLKFENELKVSIEKMMTEKIRSAEQEMQKSYHSKIQGLYQHHQEDLEQQRSSLMDEMRTQENKFLEELNNSETRLQETKKEFEHLTREKQKLENFRSEIASRFRAMMTSQWNETMTFLGFSDEELPHKTDSMFNIISDVSSIPTATFFTHSFTQNKNIFQQSHAIDRSEMVPGLFDKEDKMIRGDSIKTSLQKYLPEYESVNHQNLISKTNSDNMKLSAGNPNLESSINSDPNSTSIPASLALSFHLQNSSSGYSNLSSRLEKGNMAQISHSLENDRKKNHFHISTEQPNDFLKSQSPKISIASQHAVSQNNRFMVLPADRSPDSNFGDGILGVMNDNPEKDNSPYELDSPPEQKQSELERYIRMLLDRTVGNPLEDSLVLPVDKIVESHGAEKASTNIREGLTEDCIQDASKEKSSVIKKNILQTLPQEGSTSFGQSVDPIQGVEELTHILNLYTNNQVKFKQNQPYSDLSFASSGWVAKSKAKEQSQSDHTQRRTTENDSFMSFPQLKERQYSKILKSKNQKNKSSFENLSQPKANSKDLPKPVAWR